MKNKQKLLQYLKSQRLMTLSTYDNRPSVSSVYYAIDDTFNLYFLSEPKSKHCLDIKMNKQVGCNIADSHQLVTDKKIGVQIHGTATQLQDESLVKKALQMWNNAIPGFEHIINWENIEKKVIKSRVYKVKPVLIKFLNEELYGPEGTEIFKF